MQSVAFNQLSLLNENLYNRKYKKYDKFKTLDSNKKALYSRMMLSYFNIGVQQEHLKRYVDSEISYNRSRGIASLINDKAILKRLTKSQSKLAKGTSNSIYDRSNSNVSKIQSVRSSTKDHSNFPNFSLYNIEISDIK